MICNYGLSRQWDSSGIFDNVDSNITMALSKAKNKVIVRTVSGIIRTELALIRIELALISSESTIIKTKCVSQSVSKPVSTRRYSPLRGLTFSSCGGLWPLAEAFFALQTKKDFACCFCIF